MTTATNPSPLMVTKRDGSLREFDRTRIARAIALAYYATRIGKDNPLSDNPDFLYGLSREDFGLCEQLAGEVEQNIVGNGESNPSVEMIQDRVELTLMQHGLLDVARNYMRYRLAHAAARPAHFADNGLQEYIALSRYCRNLPERGRRELWSEAIERVRNMHLRRWSSLLFNRVDETVRQLVAEGLLEPDLVRYFPKNLALGEWIMEAFAAAARKEVLPSMRSIQFAGPAIETIEARLFNCSFSPANRLDFFREYLYLLMCGCGVGFSVQIHHIEQLPKLAQRDDEYELPVVHHGIADTIDGWADALHILLRSFIEGFKIEFSYAAIRPKGALLKTSGGRAPGHLPLKKALTAIEEILSSAAGRHLRSIEVYDICMHASQAVLSGGIRRSATICLFSPEDEEMMNAKTGNWFSTHPWRSASNNSAVLLRSQATREQFDRLFQAQKEFGEPGFFFAEDPDYGTNPCCEIGLNPRLVVTPEIRAKLHAYGYTESVREGDVLYGFQMCNLTTTNGRLANSPEAFYRMVLWATVIGSLQADYTRTAYLGPVTRILNEREALLGVSICGVLDNPEVLLEPGVLEEGAALAKAANLVISRIIGTRPAARLTCVKPEGTSSLVLGSGSGIHPHHARRYFRRVQAATTDKVYQAFKTVNPHMCEKSVYGKGMTDVITFPVEAPATAILRTEVDALTLLTYVNRVQLHWVKAGRANQIFSPGLHHNVSNTITVKENEWDAVADYIWQHRSDFTGVSLLQNFGDKVYQQAPLETVETDADVMRWNELRYKPVDYRTIQEEDATAGLEYRGAAIACAGGACELPL